jgi:uncharacterized protein YidB (DUF937 family)
MGLLDDVGGLAGLAGALGGGNSGLGGGAIGNAALLGGLMNMLNGSHSSGGLINILGSLQKAGLGDAVSSWVGTGQNQAITPDQIHQGLGSAHITELAQRAGMSEGAVASALSGLLPMVVDRLTPNGTMPSSAELPSMLSKLTGLLG